MTNGKAAGADGFIAEFYKYGSDGMKRQIHNLVKKCGQQHLRPTLVWKRTNGQQNGQKES